MIAAVDAKCTVQCCCLCTMCVCHLASAHLAIYQILRHWTSFQVWTDYSVTMLGTRAELSARAQPRWTLAKSAAC